MIKTKVFFLSLLLSSFLLASPVLAQGATPSAAPVGRRLGEVALRSCQAREEAVKNRMTSLTNLVSNIEKVFDSIAARVEAFYSDKVVPSGKTVSNYDTLVADISTKKGIVATDLTTAQSLVNSFNCSSDDPKGLLTQFRIDMQKVKSDLKDYRTSIKNLIVAVKKVAPSPSPEASESPKPTETP